MACKYATLNITVPFYFKVVCCYDSALPSEQRTLFHTEIYKGIFVSLHKPKQSGLQNYYRVKYVIRHDRSWRGQLSPSLKCT
jgi:hypothetical protein